MRQEPTDRHRALFSGSIGFYEAARSLHQVTGELHWPAFFVLMSFAAELSVKSFVILKMDGADEDTLRNTIGHDIKLGLQMAQGAGYKPPNWVTSELFDMLNKHHINHNVRYLGGPPVDMKEHKVMLKAMAHHLTTLGEQISIPVQLPLP